MSFSDYDYWNTQNPIILVNGAAGTGAISILNIMQAQGFVKGPTYAANPDSTDFVKFRIMSGHSLMNNEVATYPFANQTVAANAIITQPLELNMEMIVPATGAFNVLTKLSVMTSLKSTLDQHTAAGGWYDICTPSYIYRGCLLTSLVDASTESMGAQAQVRWVWSFMQPLLTAGEAVPAQNQDMANITNKNVNAGDPPGSKPVTVGAKKASSGLTKNIVPAVKHTPSGNTPPRTNTTTLNVVSGRDLSTNSFY